MPFFSKEQQPKVQKPPHTKIRGLKSGLGDAEVEANPLRRQRTKGRNPYRRRGASRTSPVDESDDHQEQPAAPSELGPGLPRFGPIYGDDSEAYQVAKSFAWKHIFLVQEDDSEGHYLRSVAQIQATAVEFYDPAVKANVNLASDKFVPRMARDGCFFLQLSLHILGCGDLLGYSEKHPFFGKNPDKGQWIRAMFTVGNQLPHVVIRALAKQAFFRNVISKGIERGTLRQPPKGLPELMLYLTVVEPQDNRPHRLISSLYSTLMFQEAPPRLLEPPADLLHALHSFVLGSRNDPVYSEIKEFRDLEAGSERDEEIRFPSAAELLKSGIRLRKGKRGITNIYFQNLIFRAYLYVPPFTINAHTEHMLRALTKYEQNLDNNDREVTAYLRFIRDLAQTYKSFKILEKKGIIQVEVEELKYTMVDMLNKFVVSQKCNYTLSFRQIRSKIKDYGGPPWALITFLVGLLTVVQTVFTVVSYFWPPK